MERYFDKFPTIVYGDYLALDITRRAAVRDRVLADPYAFYDYIVPEGKRADQVATDLYGDPHLAWVIYLCNRIIDPYYDWPVTYDQLITSARERFGSYENAVQSIVGWRNNWYDDSRVISESQYEAFSPKVKTYWDLAINEIGETLGYSRKKLDWKTNTNVIVRYTLSEPLGVSPGERLEAKNGEANIGFATTLHIDESNLYAQHVVNAEGSGFDLVRTNGERATVYSHAVQSRNIPLDEVAYWDSFSEWDVMFEKNEQAKFIRIIDRSKAFSMVEELKNIMRNA